MNSYSLDYIDDLYVQYVRDPSSVSDTWRQYFEQFMVGTSAQPTAGTASAGNGASSVSGSASGSTSASNHAMANGAGGNSVVAQGGTGDQNVDQALWLARIQDRVDQLVREYRVRGHLVARLDPLGLFKHQWP